MVRQHLKGKRPLKSQWPFYQAGACMLIWKKELKPEIQDSSLHHPNSAVGFTGESAETENRKRAGIGDRNKS